MSSAYTEQDLREAQAFFNNCHLLPCPTCSRLAREFARIRSEARAGMREACAAYTNTCAEVLEEGHHNPYALLRNAAVGIRKIPDLAADEAIERIKAEAKRKGRLDEARWWIAQMHSRAMGKFFRDAPIDLSVERERIAALSGKEPEHD